MAPLVVELKWNIVIKNSYLLTYKYFRYIVKVLVRKAKFSRFNKVLFTKLGNRKEKEKIN